MRDEIDSPMKAVKDIIINKINTLLENVIIFYYQWHPSEKGGAVNSKHARYFFQYLLNIKSTHNYLTGRIKPRITSSFKKRLGH